MEQLVCTELHKICAYTATIMFCSFVLGLFHCLMVLYRDTGLEQAAKVTASGRTSLLTGWNLEQNLAYEGGGGGARGGRTRTRGGR